MIAAECEMTGDYDPMKMKKAKRLLLAAVLLLSSALLSGCVSQIEEREMADVSSIAIEAGASVPLEDGADVRTMTATLYFLSPDGTMLVPVMRDIQSLYGVSRVQAALDALLAGPLEGENGVFWPDIGAVYSERMLEVSSGVATVDLPAYARTLPQETLYAIRMAIANTLTGFPEISYVNVLVGGREEGLDLGATLPVGTFSRVGDLHVRDRYNRLNDQRNSSTGVTLLTTLYFPSADGKMILPEVRSIEYAQVSPIEYLYTILEEMGKGTHNALACTNVPAPMDFIMEMPEIVRTEDGYLAIELRLSDRLDKALRDTGLSRGVYMAMLTDTLMGFVPGVEGLRLGIGSEYINALAQDETPDIRAIEFTQAVAVRSDFEGYVGAPAVLYYMDEENGMLVRTQSVVPQALAQDPREKLCALIRLSDNEVFALPQDLKPEDILAVHAGNDAVAVNLSSDFAAALSKLSDRYERAAVYAMVNTLTEGDGVERVVFFFEGEQKQALGGTLEMRGGFVRNPGMVVN